MLLRTQGRRIAGNNAKASKRTLPGVRAHRFVWFLLALCRHHPPTEISARRRALPGRQHLMRVANCRQAVERRDKAGCRNRGAHTGLIPSASRQAHVFLCRARAY
jgi:hypothetical protein